LSILSAINGWVCGTIDRIGCVDKTDDRRGRGFNIQVISVIDGAVDCHLLYKPMGGNESRDDESRDKFENAEHYKCAERKGMSEKNRGEVMLGRRSKEAVNDEVTVQISIR